MAQTRRAGDVDQFLRIAEKSRDFWKILCNRARARGVEYFDTPLQAGPVLSESRQIPKNPSKWRKPTARETWIIFLDSPRNLEISGRSYAIGHGSAGSHISPHRSKQVPFSPNSDRSREIRVNGANPPRVRHGSVCEIRRGISRLPEDPMQPDTDPGVAYFGPPAPRRPRSLRIPTDPEKSE